MKRCPTCNLTFADDTLSFCLEDGTPLIREVVSRADSQETLVSPSPSAAPPASNALPATQINPPLYNAPSAPAYAPAPQVGRKWPWVVITIAVAVMLIGGVVAVIFIPPMLRDSRNGNLAQPTPVRPQSTPAPTAPEWTATPAASPSTEPDDVPDDEDEVFSQLSKLEQEWTVANIKGDKEALERILADEYVGGPTTHTKRAYIDSLKPDEAVKSWELKDLTVEQDDDRATVHGTLTEETTTNGTEVYDFTDTFVWRDHRWQAVASKNTRVK